MNERIRQLATKCANQRSEFNGHMIYTFADNSLEKFAELIVKECADMVDRAISDGGVDGRILKEHFGVEE